MSSRPSIAQRLREVLAARKLDAQDLARAIKVSPRTMTNWTSGTTEPRAEHIAMICDHLHVSADYLVGRVDLESGLVPGTWIVDLDEFDRPTGRQPLLTELPRRPRIVTRTVADQMAADAAARTKKDHP